MRAKHDFLAELEPSVSLEDCDLRHVYVVVVIVPISCATVDGPQWLLVVPQMYVIYDSYRSDQGHTG